MLFCLHSFCFGHCCDTMSKRRPIFLLLQYILTFRNVSAALNAVQGVFLLMRVFLLNCTVLVAREEPCFRCEREMMFSASGLHMKLNGCQSDAFQQTEPIGAISGR